MAAGPIASTSTFRGFGPPAWIFSGSLDEPSPSAAPPPPPPSLHHAIPLYAPAAPPPPSHSGFGSHHNPLEPEDEDASYGPTLKRRGNVRFVRAKLVPPPPPMPSEVEDEGGKGKGRERDVKVVEKGEMVRGLYESIVGVRAPPPPPRKAAARVTTKPDVDLTLDSDSSDEDDILIENPTTGLFAPPPTPPPRLLRHAHQPSALVQLLLPPTASPLVPPISYALKPTSIGWKILEKHGWKEGNALGPDVAGGGAGNGLKVPLKASEKFDKKGLGVKVGKEGEVSRKRAREMEERRRREDRKRELDARGGKVAAKRAKREGDARKELLAYLNMP